MGVKVRWWVGGLFVALLAGCAPAGESSGIVLGEREMRAANEVSVEEVEAPSAEAAAAHAALSRLPLAISGGKEAEVAHRPGGQPFVDAQKQAAVAANEKLWEGVRSALREAERTGAAPGKLDETGGASVRDFLPLGLLASWQYRFSSEGERGLALGRLVDVYEVAVALSEKGALVHAESAKEIVSGLTRDLDLPSPLGDAEGQGQLARLRALVERAPRASAVLDRERSVRLARFAAMYREMATVEPPTDAETRAFFAAPKEPVLQARDAYWRAWMAFSEGDGEVPVVPAALTGTFSDSTEEAEAMEKMIQDIRSIRAGGEALVRALESARR